MNNFEKRESVRKNYNLIANQYSEEFGTYIEDLNVYNEFEKYLVKNAKILDLGTGSGRTYNYFKEKGYTFIGLDFSDEMKKCAYKLHGEFPYIVDDMINLKQHFSSNSIDAVFAVYSLFHLPKEDAIEVFTNVYDILRSGGIFLFSFQESSGEEMVDEPYLKEKGKNILYMNYQTSEEIKNLLDSFNYIELYRSEKIGNFDSEINSNKMKTVFVLVKKP